jgi:molybdopterin molybdotransferase
MRAHLAPGPGLPAITACARQDSSLVSVLAQADALLIRPVDDPPRPAGAVVDYLPL